METGSANRARYSRFVMPPISASASSGAVSSSKSARSRSVASGPYSFSSKTRSSTRDRASGEGQALGQQVTEEMNLDAPVAQHVRESVMLLAGPAHPQDVVEEERVPVGGREPLQLQVGTVQNDVAQPPGLRVHVESHDSIFAASGPPRMSRDTKS